VRGCCSVGLRLLRVKGSSAILECKQEVTGAASMCSVHFVSLIVHSVVGHVHCSHGFGSMRGSSFGSAGFGKLLRKTTVLGCPKLIDN
jgi:hypothetical protein